jgi:hypothetical protein
VGDEPADAVHVVGHAGGKLRCSPQGEHADTSSGRAGLSSIPCPGDARSMRTRPFDSVGELRLILLRPRTPLLGEDRPAFMIPPASGDFEVTGREALQSKAETFQ